MASYPTSWVQWVVADVHQCLAWRGCIPTARPTADSQWVDALLQSARPALAEPLQPCFVMHDYKEQNATFERAETGWRVSGIFDLMEFLLWRWRGSIWRGRRCSTWKKMRHWHRPLCAATWTCGPFELASASACASTCSGIVVVWEYFQRPGRATPWRDELTLRAWIEPSGSLRTGLTIMCGWSDDEDAAC